ncbi:MAG: hypothetical protein JXN61_02510 [Sedimentisphaerales bacterium]|nr:hypothetical protein [Sedimentisphaerales bacterium]
MDVESRKAKRCLKALSQIDFELAYLAALTAQGLKPLSRWEKPLADHALRQLCGLGLLAEQVRRTVKTGKEVIETIFSLAPGHIDLYKQRFDNTPIDKSAATQRFEGFLFGYPPCCIEQYIRQAYAPNNLPEEDQKILFHWACKGCAVTPTFLPAYRAVHNCLRK